MSKYHISCIGGFILKRLLTVLFFIFLLFTIYHDITKGSLPSKPENHTKTIDNTISYIEWRVQPGDTVLSIYEHLAKDSHHTVAIEKIITDFETLNPTVNAANIQIGQVYKIPIYED